MSSLIGRTIPSVDIILRFQCEWDNLLSKGCTYAATVDYYVYCNSSLLMFVRQSSEHTYDSFIYGVAGWEKIYIFTGLRAIGDPP